MRREDVLDEVRFLQACGEAPTAICARLTMKPGAVARALQRAGAPDLARAFEQLRDRPLPGTCRFCGRPCSHRRTACRAHKELYRYERQPRRQAVA
jgi:hypothetical protein